MEKMGSLKNFGTEVHALEEGLIPVAELPLKVTKIALKISCRPNFQIALAARRVGLEYLCLERDLPWKRPLPP